MGIEKLTPSIRLDTKAFQKALDEIGMSTTKFNRNLKNMGINLGDSTSKKNYLNKLLRDAGKPELQYKNIITSRAKSAVETGMGGVKPGKVGAPENVKIWQDITKIQKIAEKKFKKVTDQRKYFVDTMKKIYKNIPKSKILDLFKRTIRGIKSVTPIGIAETITMQMMEDPEFINSIGLGETKQMMFNQGGMMNINEITKPIGYTNNNFDDPMLTIKKRQGGIMNINDIIKSFRSR